jgi:predicted nucleic acid-binding protein
MAELIYLDTCALGRLTDDLSQPRIQNEAQAVARIIELVAINKIRWIASSALQHEISRNPFPFRRIAAMELLSTANGLVEPTKETLVFAARLEHQGFSGPDAVHLATAQQVGADALLTTDDRFLQRAQRPIQGITVPVLNPVDWLQRRKPWPLPRSSAK